MEIRENFGFYEGQNLVIEFEGVLDRNDIKVSNNCDLEKKFLSVFDILFHFEQRNTLTEEVDHRPLFRDFAALYDLSLKILSVEKHKDFKQLIPHLNILNNCSIAQNEISKITDQDANKIIELYLASLCMRFCNDITLDHPQNSTGSNPDVIADINNKNWGFACKTIHTRNTQTIFENIQKAIDQIEKSNSVTGIPVINLKNIINHDAIWPLEKTYQLYNEPLSLLTDDINSIISSLLNEIGRETLTDIFESKKSLPGILFIGQSVSSVYHEESKSPAATRLNVMNLLQLDEGKFTSEDIIVFEKINHFMQLAN